MRWLLRMRPIALLMARAAAFRRRHRVPQIEEPVAGEVFAEGAHLRIIAPQLVAHAVGEAVLLLFEVVIHARPFAQLDHQRIVDGDAAKGMAIGAQRMAEHQSVEAVVLGAGETEAIAKAVELLGIDGKHRKAVLQQRLDHRSARRLDRHRDLLRRRAGHLAEPGAHVSERGAAMGHVAFGDALALVIEHADAMQRARPIQPDKPLKRIIHRFHLLVQRATATLVNPCTGAQGANLLLDVRRGRSAGAHVLRWCSRHGVGNGGSRQIGPFAQSQARPVHER